MSGLLLGAVGLLAIALGGWHTSEEDFDRLVARSEELAAEALPPTEAAGTQAGGSRTDL